MKTINLLAAMYVVGWALFPFMSVAVIYRLVAIAAVLVWLLTVRSVKPDFYNCSSKVLIIGSVYLILTFFNTFLLTNSISKSLSDTVNPFIILIILLFYYAYNDSKYLENLAIFALVCYMIVAVMSIYQLNIDERAARDAYTQWNKGNTELLETIGTYGFIMSSCLIPMISLTVLTQKKINRAYKLLFGCSGLICAMLTLKSGYLTAIIVMVISLIVFLCMHKFSVLKLVIIVTVLTLVIIFQRQIISWAFDLALSLTQGNVAYHERVQEIYDFLILGADATGDLAERFSRYTKTLSEIVRNPILGAALLRGSYRGGGHSELLDGLGKFGLPYLICHIWVTIVQPASIIRKKGINDMFWAFTVSVVCFSILDPYSYIIMVVSAVIMPYVVKLCTANPEQTRRRRVV